MAHAEVVRAIHDVANRRPSPATSQERLLLAIFGLRPNETFDEALRAMRRGRA